MTVHTRLGGRNSREGSRFHRRVAIPAIDAVIADMVEVAELDRLFDELLGAGYIRGSTDDDQKTNEPAR
jgi:hypothetical protein